MGGRVIALANLLIVKIRPIFSAKFLLHTQGDLTQIFPTIPNPIVNLDFHMPHLYTAVGWCLYGARPSSQLVCKPHFWNINSSVWAVWTAQGSKEKKSI